MSDLMGLSSEQVIEMDAGFPVPASLQHAVVFVRASWSGDSKVTLMNLVEGMRSGLDRSWKLIVLDTDTLDFDEFTKFYGRFPSGGGRGETFWIGNAKLAYGDGGYYNFGGISLLWKRILEFSVSESFMKLPSLSIENSFRQSALDLCQGLLPECLDIEEQECPEIRDLRACVATLYNPNRFSSVVTLRNLALALTEQKLFDVRLRILNTSTVSYSGMERIFRDAPTPARTFWIRYGKVVFKDDGYYLPEHRNILLDRINSFSRLAD